MNMITSGFESSADLNMVARAAEMYGTSMICAMLCCHPAASRRGREARNESSVACCGRPQTGTQNTTFLPTPQTQMPRPTSVAVTSSIHAVRLAAIVALDETDSTDA